MPSHNAPKTRFARSGEIHIAHQVVGEGPFDLVLVPGWVSNVEEAWEEPNVAAFLRRLSSFARLILLDRRGTGLSDRVSSLPTLEERMDDVRAVMDAVGSARAALVGISEGGAMCSLFAATHPERTAALVLCNSFAYLVRDADHPWAPPRELWARYLDLLEEHWGDGVTAEIFAPSRAGDPEFVRGWGRFERRSVSPGGARMLLRIAMDTDVRAVLPTVLVPTLVLHRIGDRVARVEGARYMAARIPGARLVELPGADHFVWTGDMEALVGELEEFLTGTRSAPESDRVLATVLFVDVVGSTEKLTELGDRAYADLLERYQALARSELSRFGGRVVDTAGDGVFARFDGPARAVRCALALRGAVAALGLRVRAGVHTGECQVSGPGAERITGIAVHLGARICSEARGDEVLVSGTVRDLVAGSGLEFAEQGSRPLAGIPGTWRLYAAGGA